MPALGADEAQRWTLTSPKVIMPSSNEETRKLPPDLLSSLGDARTAIVQQKYREALSVLEQGLGRKYDPAELDSLYLLEHFRGLIFVLEFNLRQAFGIDWQEKAKIPKIPEKGTSCSFCGQTYAEVAKLITGAEGNICNECVEICHELLADD
jgi:hypothetical protein